MPIYEYIPLYEGCPFCPDRFEVLQDVGEAPLQNCPTCDAPCRKVLSVAAVKTGTLGQDKLEQNGFLQYKKTSQGVYERTAGTDEQGPRTIVRED